MDRGVAHLRERVAQHGQAHVLADLEEDVAEHEASGLRVAFKDGAYERGLRLVLLFAETDERAGRSQLHRHVHVLEVGDQGVGCVVALEERGGLDRPGADRDVLAREPRLDCRHQLGGELLARSAVATRGRESAQARPSRGEEERCNMDDLTQSRERFARFAEVREARRVREGCAGYQRA